jgi:catechol 2,3-dioxygenase-like lactoylglutathione lyase family enzyme
VGIKIGNLAIDCADAQELASFYSSLLGWTPVDKWGCPAVVSPDGANIFIFMQEDDYVPPVWPEAPAKQQKMMHLDFFPDDHDYDGAINRALSLGAKRAEAQYNPEHWTVMLDPAGHPFCICRTGLDG